MVSYFHLLKNFSQFIMIHTVKGFSIVNKAEVDVFLELSCFFDDPKDVSNLISGSSAFSKSSYGEGGGRGVHVWERMHTHGGFMSMYGKTNTVL